jgi:hypothetical protein
MASIDEVLAAVQAESAGVDSVVAMVATLKQQVIDALGKAVTPEVQAKIDQIFDLSTSDAAKLNAAVAAPAV